jgi:nucleolar protein TMA23
MDAHAHLLSLGWAGPGHSLDSRPYNQKGHRGLAYDPAKVGNNGTGLVKPLSISQRQGRFGIGKKAHEPQAGNEWWLKGFESALGNIGKSESERSSGTSTPISREYTGKHGGLYSFFIKGQQMEGTMDKQDLLERSSKKRKSDVLREAVADDTPKPPKPKKEKATSEFEQAGAFFALRDKDEKRRRGTGRPSPIEEFEQIGEYLEVQTRKPKKKKRKSDIVDSGARTPLQTVQVQPDEPEHVETKEERRERRRRRIEEKEHKRQQIDSKTEHDAEDAAAKTARKAERKRRKAEKAAKSSKS